MYHSAASRVGRGKVVGRGCGARAGHTADIAGRRNRQQALEAAVQLTQQAETTRV